MRLIAGLEEPEMGEIRFGDRVIFSRREGVIVPPERRNLGLIFQSYALWPHMTVERNITLALKEQRLSPREISERLEAALEKVQMTPYQFRYPSELSGGQQQRVAVARLIASRSSILLMDEPLSNLDAKLRTEMRGELKRLHLDLEATTTSAPNTPLKRISVRTRSHARPEPMPTPKMVTQTPMPTLLSSGFRNRALESGPVKTRSR